MTLVTKAGTLLVKDGALQQGCECCAPTFTCGACTAIPSSLTATISSAGGYISDMGCVFGSSTLLLSRPNFFQKAAPSGCWNSQTGAFCDESIRTDLWTSGVDTSVGGILYKSFGQCIDGLGARVNPQMFVGCGVVAGLFIRFSCGRNPSQQTGCPTAYDQIGSNFGGSFDTLQINLTITSCSPFLATGSRVTNGVTLTASVSGNPLP
jgi:hypothetical protein